MSRNRGLRPPARRPRTLLSLLTTVLLVVSLAAVGVVTAPSAAAAPVPFGSVFSTQDNGAISLIGNSQMSCPTAAPGCPAGRSAAATSSAQSNVNDNDFAMAFVDTDSDNTTGNSSSADLSLPSGSTVLSAFLVWGGRRTDGSGNLVATTTTARTVKFKPTGASSYSVLTGSYSDLGTSDSSYPYQGYADVTAAVRAAGNGTYWVADIAAGTGGDRYAGWSLIVAYRNPAAPLRDLQIYQGFSTVSGNTPTSIPISGFLTPASGTVSSAVGVVAWEGDRGFVGDGMQFGGATSTTGTTLSDATRPANNFFNSGISDSGTPLTARNPNYSNNFGVDIGRINGTNVLNNSQTSTYVNLTTNGDTYYPGIVTTQIDLFTPAFNPISKSVVNLSGNNPAKVGDTLRYQVSLTNTGSDPATNSIITDALPPNTTYVPGSLVLEANPGSTPSLSLTDASGDDQGEYVPASRSVRFRVGQGATATAGGTIGVNQTVTVRFRVTLDRASAGTIVPNVANLGYTAFTLNKPFTFIGNEVDTPVSQLADLAIAKTSSPATQTAGSNVVYQLTATNNGPNAATNVVLTDTLPTGVTFSSASPPAGTTCSNSGQVVTCTSATLANGGTIVVPITTTIAPGTAAGSSLIDVATVGSDTGDDVPTNNTANATTQVTTSADVSLTKTVSPNPVAAGAPVTYTLTALNKGPSTANAVTISDPLPLGLNYTISTPTGVCSNNNGVVSCALGALAPNTSSAVKITAGVASNVAAGTITNSATASSSTPDPVSNNNTATTPVNVTTSADLSITKKPSAGSVVAGTPVSYTLTVTNNGTSDAAGVVVTDPAVTGLTVTSAASSQGTCAVTATAVTCPVGTVVANGTVTVTVLAQVDSTQPPGPLTNQASVSSTTADPVLGNNSTTASITVTNSADMSLTKTSNPATITIGNPVTYTLSAYNNGPSSATNVVITDTLPAGLTFTGSNAGCTASGQIVTCVIGSVANQATPVVTITASTSGTNRTITNVATVASDNDPNSLNNTASAISGTAQVADLTMSKTGSTAAVPGGTATYTLRVHNNGPSTANTVQITDTLPAGLTAATITPSVGTCTGTGTAAVSCTAPSLASGSDITVTLVVNVASTALGSVTNTAKVSSPTTDPTPGNNTDSQTTTLTPQADVSVKLTGPTDPVTAGDTTTFQLTVANNGPSTARNVVVTGQLPPGLIPVLGSSQGACTFNAGTGTVTCVIPFDIPPNTTLAAIPLQAIVDPSQPAGPINPVPTATVGSATPDTNPGNNTASWPVTVRTSADLSMAKSVTPNPLVAGAPATYTLTATNNGLSDAQNVLITDSVPAGLTIVSANPSLGSCTVTGQNVACGAATVQANSTFTVTLITKVAASATGSISNTAAVSSPTDSTPGNNSATSTAPVNQTAHLVMTKTASPDPIVAGAAVTYTLSIVNNGPSDALNTVVTDPLPTGFAVFSNGISSTGNVCPQQDQATTVTCSFGTIPAGTARTLQITASTPAGLAAGSTITNTATLASPTPDSDPSGRTASVTNTVVTSADLSISKAPVTDPIEAGAQQTYVVQVTNNGPSVSRGVVVTDALPAGVTFVSITPSTGCTTGSTITCSLGDLGRSATITLQITVQLASNIGGTALANTATVASAPTSGTATPDPNTGNNSSSVSQKVATRSDLSLTKAITSGPIVAGSTVTYQLVATNNGPSDTTNLVLSDPLPAGTSLVTANASGGGACQLTDPVVCSWPSVAAGDQRTVTLSVAVPASAAVGSVVTNTATITSDNLNTTPETSTATASGPVTASADVSVVKTLLSGNPVAGGTATWQMVVQNAGPSQAANVVLDDAAPTGVTFTSATPSASCTITGNALHCGFGVLSANTSVTATVTGTLSADYSDPQVTNSATAGSDTPDPDTSNNSSSATADTTTSADLSVTKVATSSPFVAGNPAGWTLTVTNAGLSTAQNVVVTDVLPAGITDGAGQVAGVACTSAAGTGANAGSTVLTCPVGTVSMTAPVQISVTGTVLPSLVAPSVTNTATVAATTPDPNSGNNTVSVTTPVTTSADLSLTKAGPATVHSGEAINWTLTVGNAGPSDAQGATVTDTLPSGLTGVTATGPGGACSVSATAVTCAVGTVADGSSATVTVSATVGPDTVGTLHNSATVTSSTADPDTTNNTGTFDTTATRNADVSVTKLFSGSSAVPGHTVRWTIAAGNAGPSTATGVVVTDTLPTTVSGITATFGPSHTACTVTGQDVSCPLGTLTVGAVVNISVSGTLAASDTSATLDNTASISSPDDTETPGNNSATSSTPVAPSADLSIGKALTSGTPVGGDKGVYTLTVNNAGPSDATNVVVTDTLPTLFRNVTAVVTGAAGLCTVTGNALQCTFASVPVGTVPVVTLKGTFDQNLGTTISNTGLVSADTADPITSNNSSTATGSLGESADLQVSKQGPATVIAGNPITWTVKVRNAGPSNAREVTVSDTIPDGVTNASAVITGGSTCVPASCAVGTIASGATATITVSGTVSSAFLGSSLVNTVAATSASPDPNGGNNQAMTTTEVTNAAHLTVAKAVTPTPLVPGRTASYLITVTNSGPSDAQADVVTDPLPDGLSVGPAGPSSSQGSCQMVGRTASCPLGVLSAGNRATITVPVVVDPGYASPSITNTATVSSPTPDTNPDPAGRTGSVTTDVTPLADLTLIKTGPISVLAGNGVSWTLTLTNAGPSVARDVVVTDPVPTAVTGVAASATQGNCTLVANLVTCDIGILAAGDTARITLFVTGTVDPATTVTSLVNTATVTSSTPEPVPGPDNGRSSTATTDVSAQADLVVAKIPAATSFTAGGPASWTITVTNLGPSTATNTTVTDNLPAGLNSPVFTDSSSHVLNCPAGVCALGTIAPNTSVSITVSGTIDPDFADTGIVNTATAHSDTADPVEGNNTASYRVPVTTQAHLVVVKKGPLTVVAGNTITWTVQVSNTGLSTARGVQLADQLPAGISDISFASPVGGSCPTDATAGSTATCTLPDLAAGATASTITVTATVDAGYSADSIANTATAKTSTPQSGPAGEDTDTFKSAVTTSANLSITKTGPDGAVTAGHPISWTVVVTNGGPSVARSVTVDDPELPGVSGLTGTWAGGSCATTCAIGDLAVHGSVSITFKATVGSDSSDDSLTNTATVSSATDDPDPSNNSAQATTTINRSADLSLVKTVSPNPVIPGRPVTYTLTVHNAGPSDATGVSLFDELPAALLHAAAPGCAVTLGVLGCQVGTVAAGATTTVTVTGTLSADVDPGTVSNTASVTATTPDPDLSNNTSTVSAGVAQANLAVTKKPSAPSVRPGGTLSWTITSTNHGSGPARHTVVTDRIPDGTTLVGVRTSQGSCTSAGQVVTCSIGTVEPGAVATVVVTAKVDADRTAALTNATSVLSPDESDPSDNVAQATTPVVAVADLSLTKKVTSGPVVAGGGVTWQLVVTNQGPATAPSVVITDPVANVVTGLKASAGCTVSGGTVRCAVGSLAAGKSATVTISGTVAPTARGTLTNTASVTSPVPDPNPQNDTATTATAVGLDSRLSVRKTADVASVAVTGAVTYTIQVTQGGRSASNPVTVTESLPAGATVVDALAGQGSYATGSGVWAVGQVAPGGVATLTLTVQMGQAGTAVNSVALTESGTTAKASAQATVMVAAPPPPPPPTEELPKTGFAATRFLVLGLALLLGGAVLVFGGRRRRSSLR